MQGLFLLAATPKSATNTNLSILVAGLVTVSQAWSHNHRPGHNITVTKADTAIGT